MSDRKRPISTAPKDGTWLLLFGGHTDENDYAGDGVEVTRPVTAKWFDGEWVFCYWDGAWRSCYMDPTHWKLA